MAIAKSILKNCALFVNDGRYIGQIDEVTLPKLTTKDEEYQGAGMGGPVSIPMSIEKLEASFVTSSALRDILASWGLRGANSTKLEFRGGLEDLDGTTTADIAKIRGRISGFDEGASKPGDKRTWTFTVQVLFYERSIGGRETIYIDLENNVCRVNGVDQWAGIRGVIEG